MRFSITLFFLAIILLFSTNISANTFIVTNTNDSGAGSLREAVNNANSTTQADSIVFDWTLFGSAQTITLTSGEILITQPLQILGPGESLLRISGNSNSRVFFLQNTAIVNLSNLTIANGKAPLINPNGGFGNHAGGIYINGGQLYLSQVTVTDCRAEQAGGIYNQEGVLHVINSKITNNQAIEGRNDGSYGGGLNNQGTLIISGSSITGNIAQGGSANMFTTSVGSGIGGGIQHFSGSLTITNSIIANNSALGGISTGAFGGSAFGAGIAVRGEPTRISNTLIFNNVARAGAGDIPSRAGRSGGGGISNGGNTELYNVTVSNNSVSSTNFGGGISGGGGISNSCSDCMTVTNSTVVNNTAEDIPGGGIFAYYSFRLRNSIVANNSSSAYAPDIYDTVTSFGNNFVGNADGSFGMQNGVNNDQAGTTTAPINPMLAPLADNGGTTQTYLPLVGSPVINRGNNCVLQSTSNGGCLTNPLTTDQRGFNRLDSPRGTVDIGAVEYGSTPSAIAPVSAPDLQAGSDSGTSNTDNLTSSRALVFDISGIPAQATVDLLRNGVVVASLYSANGGTVSLTDAPNANGVFEYASRVTIASAVSSISATLPVTVDTARPTVTVNQAAGQSDPTDILPISFIAEFSKPVYGLNASGISFAGSTANTSAASVAISPIGQDGKRYLITVGNITSTGSVRVSLSDGAATDSAGNTNLTSTATDNSVAFNLIIAVTLEGKVSRSSGVVRSISFVTLTDNQTGTVYSTVTNQLGYFHFKNISTYQQTGRNFTINVQNKSFSSTSQQFFVNSDRNDVNIIVP